MFEEPDHQDDAGRAGVRRPIAHHAAPGRVASRFAAGNDGTSGRRRRAAAAPVLRSVLRTTLIAGLLIGVLSTSIAVARKAVRDTAPATSAVVPPAVPSDAAPDPAESEPAPSDPASTDPATPAPRTVPQVGSPASTSPPQATSRPTATSRPPAPARPVPKQLRFKAKTLDGDTFAGASLAGKPAVLFFWTPWCGVCRSEAPGVARVAKRFSGKVKFVGIAGQDSEEAMSKFVAETDLGFLPHVVDADGKVWSSFGISAQPSFAFITARGKVEVQIGSAGEDWLASKAEELRG